MMEGILYRSASPSDNSHNRASVVDGLIEDVGVQYILNLSDSDDDLKAHIDKEDFHSPYFYSLYQNHKVMPLSMSMQFENTDFSDKLVKGLTALSKNDGPYLVHCVEGKDRTGFVVMVLEALVGAKYQEMVDDYMETYQNYYSITLKSDKRKYNTIKEKNIDFMLHYITETEDDEDLEKINYEEKAKDYLSSIGMKDEDIKNLQSKLKKVSLGKKKR